MTALVRNSPDMPHGPQTPPARNAPGFGPDADGGDQLGRAALTVLLVLYPALASVAVVVAALMLSGSAFGA